MWNVKSVWVLGGETKKIELFAYVWWVRRGVCVCVRREWVWVQCSRVQRSSLAAWVR